MTSLYGIPIDIGAHIVDSLANSENGQLHVKACALVCRAFLPLCRKHIFRSVAINKPYSNSPRLHHARALFARNPMLAQCVRKLDFCIRQEDFISPDFVFTLDYFTNVQYLNLWYHGIDKLDWQHLPRHAHKTFLHLLHLPTLVSLKLRNITNVPIADLVPCINISHLAIDQVEPLIADGRDQVHIQPSLVRKWRPLPSIHIEEYTFGLCSAALTNEMLHSTRSDGAPAFDFTGLKCFSAKCDSEDDLTTVHSLLSRAEGLEVIHLKISEALSLRGLARFMQRSAVERTLKSASFAMCINDESEDPLAGLCEELDDIRIQGQHQDRGANGNGVLNGNVLETLAIHVMILPDAGCKRGHEWGKLDAVLARPGWYALRRVSLQVTIWDFMRISSDILKYTLEMLLDTQFLYLSRNEDIDFRFNVDVKELMQE